MSKMTGLLGGLAMMCTTLVAAAPQVTTPQQASRATSAAEQPLSWEQPQQQAAVCNLLCIVGDHCCIINNKATCIPNTIPCPPQ